MLELLLAALLVLILFSVFQDIATLERVFKRSK